MKLSLETTLVLLGATAAIQASAVTKRQFECINVGYEHVKKSEVEARSEAVDPGCIDPWPACVDCCKAHGWQGGICRSFQETSLVVYCECGYPSP